MAKHSMTTEEIDALGHRRFNNAMLYSQVHQERVRAHVKHGANGNSREDAQWDNAEWLPILMEELGEVAHWWTYDTDKEIDELRDELIQVAAMACAWIAAIDERMETLD